MIYDLLQYAIFVIGVIAIFYVYSKLFFTLDRGPAKLFTNNPIPDVSSDDFILALSQTVSSSIEHGGSVEILNNGDGFFPVLLAEIAKAEKSINFTVYIWHDGKISDQIIKGLTARQNAGVQVRILLDGVGGRNASINKFEELIKAGGKVEWFRTFKLGKLTRYHRRTHRRSIVIDGKIGFTGGMAVMDCWLGNAENPKQWRDMMFKVSGPMARSLQSAFTNLWTSTTGEIMFGSGTYPTHLPDENRDVKFIHLISSPTESMPLQKFILIPMMAARQKLYITTPYFVANNHLMETLKERAKTGVDVRLLLPSKFIDNPIVRWNAHYFYYDLLMQGVKIYEYQPTFIHSKYFVVDGKWSVIGSANLNNRSRNLDEENSFGIMDENLANQLEQTFFNDLKLSKQITLKTWKKRNFLYKILVFFTRIIEEQS